MKAERRSRNRSDNRNEAYWFPEIGFPYEMNEEALLVEMDEGIEYLNSCLFSLTGDTSASYKASSSSGNCADS